MLEHTQRRSRRTIGGGGRTQEPSVGAPCAGRLLITAVAANDGRACTQGPPGALRPMSSQQLLYEARLRHSICSSYSSNGLHQL